MCKVTRKVGGQPCSDSFAGIVGEMNGTLASSIAGRIFASALAERPNGPSVKVTSPGPLDGRPQS